MMTNNAVVIYEAGLKESGACYKNVVYSRFLADALMSYDDPERNYLIRYTYPSDPLRPRKVEYWDNSMQDFVLNDSVK